MWPQAQLAFQCPALEARTFTAVAESDMAANAMGSNGCGAVVSLSMPSIWYYVTVALGLHASMLPEHV
jgi:hypothetical protein